MAKKKKKIRFKKKVIIIFDLFLLILVLGAGTFLYLANKTQRDNSGDDQIVTNDIDNANIGGYRNIALFGVDSRDNSLEKSTHSDTIIVASINRKTKDIKLASIYRDTYVEIPENGFNKINAAYFKGGYPLALNTINTNFDLDVKEFVTVNFNAIVNVIDLLGGITLDITDAELKYVNGYTKELNQINGTKVGKLKSSGTQLVNGTHATAYARIRYTKGGDIKRAERQRIVVQKIFEKAKEADLATITAIINEIFPQIYTNLDNMDMLSLAKDIFSYNIVDQIGFPFENSAEYYNKISYVFPLDLEANVIKLHELLFETTDYTPTAKVHELSETIKAITDQ